MKAKLFALALCAASAFCAEAGAQIIRDDELAKYAVEKYGEDWEEAASKIAAEHPLDANNAFTFTEVLQAPGMDANKIYDELQMWFTSTFCRLQKRDTDVRARARTHNSAWLHLRHWR